MTLSVALVDYGAGNLHSLRKALENEGARVAVADGREEAARKPVLESDAVVLPGVGAFGQGVEGLAAVREALLARMEEGAPVLGVCLGMQLLFERSRESPGAPGLGYIRGAVEALGGEKLPQIGWNVVAFREDPIFAGLPEGSHVYYVNSYAPVPQEPVTIATTTYGATFTAAVRKRNTWGLQFHPEKSSRVGLTMIRNFVRFAEGAR